MFLDPLKARLEGCDVLFTQYLRYRDVMLMNSGLLTIWEKIFCIFLILLCHKYTHTHTSCFEPFKNTVHCEQFFKITSSIGTGSLKQSLTKG